MTVFQSRKDCILTQAQLFPVDSKLLRAVCHQCPASAGISRIISVLSGKLRHLIRRYSIVTCQSRRHHGDCRRPASVDSDHVIRIKRISPSFIPLKEQRNLTLYYFTDCVRRRCIFLFRIIKNKIHCLLIVFQQFNQLFRILVFIRHHFSHFRVEQSPYCQTALSADHIFCPKNRHNHRYDNRDTENTFQNSVPSPPPSPFSAFFRPAASCISAFLISVYFISVPPVSALAFPVLPHKGISSFSIRRLYTPFSTNF